MCRCVRQKGVVNISVHISFTLATLAGCVYASVLIRLSGKSLGMIGHFFWLGAEKNIAQSAILKCGVSRKNLIT